MRKLLVLATIVALAMTAASPASATIVDNLGINPTSATGDFASGTLGVNATGFGLFSDQFLFQLTNASSVTIASATNVFPGGPGTTDFITNFSASVFSYGANNLFEAGGGDDVRVLGPANAIMGCGPIVNCQGMAGIAVLNAGNFYLDISGTGGGTSGYGGNIATLAVPGPVAGIGLPGVIAGCMLLLGMYRRRRQAQA